MHAINHNWRTYPTFCFNTWKYCYFVFVRVTGEEPGWKGCRMNRGGIYLSTAPRDNLFNTSVLLKFINFITNIHITTNWMHFMECQRDKWNKIMIFITVNFELFRFKSATVPNMFFIIAKLRAKPGHICSSTKKNAREMLFAARPPASAKYTTIDLQKSHLR